MSLPVAIVTSGGLPIQESLTAFGLPVELSSLPGAVPCRIVTSGGVPCLDAVGNVFGVSFTLAGDSLVWTSGANVAVPVLQITIPDSVTSGYKIRGQTSANADMSSPIETISAVIAAEDLDPGDLQIDDFTFTALANGLKYIQVWITDGSDVQASNKSNIVSKTLDSTAPTITSSNSGNNTENATLAKGLTANESVTWTITGGADAARFELSGSTLRWASNGVKDFETPNDADTNNTYVVQVTATDAATNATNQTITITVVDADELAPTLSSPTDTSTGQTTADAVVTTNEANGTLYCVVTTSGTAPSAAQVKLGQDNSSVAATYAANVAVSSTGAKTFNATGLTAATAYTAHFMHEDAVGNQSAVSSGNGFTTDSGVSAEVSQYLARATGMDATHVNAFTALIDGLVADSVWSLLDCLYVFATDTEAHAKLNLKSSSYTIAETGTVSFTADVGYSPSGGDTSNYLSSQFNPSTAGGQYAQNSAHMSIWSGASYAGAAIGSYTAETQNLLFNNFSGTSYCRINGGNISVADADGIGHYIGVRSASTTLVMYKNGSSTVSDSGQDPAGSLHNVSIIVGGYDNLGTPTATGGGPHSAASIGGALDGTKAAALYNRLATYRTAVGL